MVILGAHMSVAGGFDQAVQRAHDAGCQCVQLFTSNQRQWQPRTIRIQEARAFRAALERLDIAHPLAHSSYLLNLASPDESLWKKSIEALVAELRRADRLGIAHVVVHPGAHIDGDERLGLQRITRALDRVQRRTARLGSTVLLENTAGQGTCLGWQFEHLQFILDGVRVPERLGICLDTCHAFAAGYAWAEQADYRRTLRALDQTVGLDRVRAIHLNDCPRPLGARVDRHAHIGQGQIGLAAFARLVNDRRLRQVPMYLETPKGAHPDQPGSWDEHNLRTLRQLVRRRAGRMPA